MKISIIGGGAMGSALAEGLISQDSEWIKNIIIADPHLSKLERLKNKGVHLTTDNLEAVRRTDLIVVAVKPWIVEKVINDLKTIKLEGKKVCFILAGISSSHLLEMFQENIPSQLAIVMPNTAMSVGKSMTFIVSVIGENTGILELFDMVGTAMQIEERQLPAAMALASCGIAFAMRYIRASTEAGVELGVKAIDAQKMVEQTLEGAVAILRRNKSNPEEEIDKVTTPGGFTIKGLNTMEKFGFSSAIIEGLKACKP